MHKFLFIAASILIFIIGCGQKPEQEDKTSTEPGSTFDSTSLQTTKIEKEDVGKPFYIHYKFKPGETVKYRMTIFSRNEQHIEADTIMDGTIEQKIIYLIDLKTLSLDEDSIAEIQCTVNSINLKASGMGNEVTYQSGDKIDSTELSKFAEHESFINNPFNLRINKSGRLIEIYKTDKIINRFLSLRGLIDSVKTEDLDKLKQDLSERVIKPFVVQIIREVPEHKVAMDSTWSYQKQSIPIMTFNVDYKNIYKVGSIEQYEDQKIAVIDGTIESRVEGKTSYNEMGISYQFEKPISSASGKIYFNLARGLIQKSKTETRMETAFTMEMPTPQGMQKGKTREIITNTNVLELL